MFTFYGGSNPINRFRVRKNSMPKIHLPLELMSKVSSYSGIGIKGKWGREEIVPIWVFILMFLKPSETLHLRKGFSSTI